MEEEEEINYDKNSNSNGPVDEDSNTKVVKNNNGETVKVSAR